jgi:hypothetical protein
MKGVVYCSLVAYYSLFLLNLRLLERCNMGCCSVSQPHACVVCTSCDSHAQFQRDLLYADIECVANLPRCELATVPVAHALLVALLALANAPWSSSACGGLSLCCSSCFCIPVLLLLTMLLQCSYTAAALLVESYVLKECGLQIQICMPN